VRRQRLRFPNRVNKKTEALAFVVVAVREACRVADLVDRFLNETLRQQRGIGREAVELLREAVVRHHPFCLAQAASHSRQPTHCVAS